MIKLFIDIAKALGLSTKIISYGLVIILTAGGTLFVASKYSEKNRKIEAIPELMKYLARMDSSNTVGHNYIIKRIAAIDSVQRRSNYLFREKTRIDSLKFSRIPVLKENDYFQIMDQWFYRLQSTGMLEKKNTSPSILYGSNRTN